MERRKCAIYARVSTGKQNERLEEQIRIINEYCESRIFNVFNIYAETTSGTNTMQREFDRLMRDVYAKRFDVVVVLKLDRFSRSMRDLINNVECLKNADVEFISINDGIETTTAQGKLLFHVMGAIAEFERSLICDRTQIGIERAKREGKLCHRPRKTIDMKKVINRYEQGISLTEIADIVHVSYSTLRNRIREEKIDLEAIRKAGADNV